MVHNIAQMMGPNGTSKPLSSEEYAQLRATWANETPGTLSGIDCPLCLNRGYTTVVGESGHLTTLDCVCLSKRRSLQRIRRSGLSDALQRCTFDTFEVREPWQAEMLRKARAFVNDDTGAWFVAAGAVGSGKTHLCTAICGELIERGREVRYFRWRDESVPLKGLSSSGEEYKLAIEPWKAVPVLYIDDLFKTQRGAAVTSADVNLAFEILNARYNDRRLITIVSSEKTLDEIMLIDEAIGSRLFERSRGFYIRLSGSKNQRLI